MWDPTTGKAVGNPLTGHRKWITGVAWEPAHLQVPCRRFASASKDGDVRIWDTVLQKSVLCLSGHTLAVTCVKWSGDGFIFSGSQDCTIKVWETTQGKLIRELKVFFFLFLLQIYLVGKHSGSIWSETSPRPRHSLGRKI
jgi:ribosome assembly protein 4